MVVGGGEGGRVIFRMLIGLHIWGSYIQGVLTGFYDMLDKLQKCVCGAIILSVGASSELLAHCENIARVSLFYSYYFGRFYLNLLNWFYFFILVGGQLIIPTSCLIFLSPFFYVKRMPMSTVSFFCTE